MSDPYSNLIVGKLKLKGMPIKKKWVNRRKSIGRSKKVHKKKETAEANCLILHNKSFTLLCRKGVREEDAERMKQSIFSVRDVKG